MLCSLQINPRLVDVNVHPTKKEVHFLNEDAIIERIADAVQKTLIGQSQSRVFEYQVYQFKIHAHTPWADRCSLRPY